MRFRSKWEEIDQEHIEILRLLADDLTNKASELGPLQMLEHLEETLSNVLLISDRQPLVSGKDPRKELDDLYTCQIENFKLPRS